MATKKATPSWIDVKAKLADFDRAGLLTLVQDLYTASKDNQAFLHARLHLGDDALKPYKATIDRWLWPDVFKNQDTSVAKAKKAIADYKKALGAPDISRPMSKPSLMRRRCITSCRSSRETLTVTASVTWLQRSRR